MAEPAQSVDRHPLGKADLIGSCYDHCGGKSKGTCWCDDWCSEFGDCCADYEAKCSCEPVTCGEGDCGEIEDGCGHKLDCGSCCEDPELVPQDIIVLVDNSGSMANETAAISELFNALSTQVAEAEVDVRVILISGYEDNSNVGVCVDPPLGSGGCPTADDNPPAFRHLGIPVSSHNALDRAVELYADFADDLRDNAQTHVVVVTDDDSGTTATEFTERFGELSPNLADFVFHAVAAPESAIEACINGTSCCGVAGGAGSIYMELVEQTGGVFGNLCDGDFAPVFDAIGQAAIDAAEPPC